MASKICVGNLPFKVDQERLNSGFAEFGTVVGAKIIIDKKTNRSRGYGFVEFEDLATAEKAVEEMNGKELDGRNLTVSLAKTQD